MKIGLIRLRADLMLLGAAIIWGVTFAAQKSAMDNVGPISFNAIRCLIAAFSLYIASFFIKDKQQRKRRPLIEGGLITGTVLFLALAVQQIGIINTTAGKAGFISSLYIVIVAIFSWFLGNKISKYVWYAIFIAVIGLYLLSSPENGFSMGKGDITVLFSAVFFAIHIICISKYVHKTNPVHLAGLQFFVAGILGTMACVIVETPNVINFQKCLLEIIFAGIFGGGVAYTLQIMGQKHVKAHIASLILSLESVFSVASGFIFLNEILSLKEILGCSLLLIAVFIAQKKKK